MMKQRWGLDRNVLRPTPGDPWVVENHHWSTGAKEQLNPGGGPSNRVVWVPVGTVCCMLQIYELNYLAMQQIHKIGFQHKLSDKSQWPKVTTKRSSWIISISYYFQYLSVSFGFQFALPVTNSFPTMFIHAYNRRTIWLIRLIILYCLSTIRSWDEFSSN